MGTKGIVCIDIKAQSVHLCGDRIVIVIFAFATLDNYRWCTRGVDHTNSDARPADCAASRKLPCYHVRSHMHFDIDINDDDDDDVAVCGHSHQSFASLVPESLKSDIPRLTLPAPKKWPI